MMTTAIAISPMMRNILSVATILPTAVKASDMARIAPTIVPMIRRMFPVCARGPLAGDSRADRPALGPGPCGPPGVPGRDGAYSAGRVGIDGSGPAFAGLAWCGRRVGGLG